MTSEHFDVVKHFDALFAFHMNNANKDKLVGKQQHGSVSPKQWHKWDYVPSRTAPAAAASTVLVRDEFLLVPGTTRGRVHTYANERGVTYANERGTWPSSAVGYSKSSQRALDEMQRTIIEIETKYKGELSRLKKKYESELRSVCDVALLLLNNCFNCCAFCTT